MTRGSTNQANWRNQLGKVRNKSAIFCSSRPSGGEQNVGYIPANPDHIPTNLLPSRLTKVSGVILTRLGTVGVGMYCVEKGAHSADVSPKSKLDCRSLCCTRMSVYFCRHVQGDEGICNPTFQMHTLLFRCMSG